MDRYEVSVAVLTYKPNKDKLLETLQSILMQKDVRLQIVIADDGSAETQFEAAEAFFKDNGFTDYMLVDNKVNRGTVYNVQSAVARCEGTYVKLISPGDLLSSQHILRRWVDKTSAAGADVSFSDAVYYVPGENEKQIISQPTHPLDVSCYLASKQNAIRYHYLILNDIVLGATTLCRQEIIKKYIDEIAGKVCYAEDHIYRLMVYDWANVYYFPEAAVLYETSTGISTSGNGFWQKKLQEDWNAATTLLLARCTGEDPLDRKLLRLNALPSGKAGKLLEYLYFPKMFFFNLKKRFSPRKSTIHLPESQ